MTRPLSLADLEAALRFSRAPRVLGHKPDAGPSAWYNDHATRVTDAYVNIERDGPRRLDEGGVPYYKRLPQGIVGPVVLAAALKRARGVPALGMPDWSKFKQAWVDGVVAVYAALKALALYRRGDRDDAVDVLCRHFVHLARLYISVGIGAGFLLMVLFL